MIVAYCGGLRLRNASPGRADAKIPTEQDTAQGADHGALEGGQVGDPSLGHQATHRVVENRQHIGRLLRRWSQTPSHWRWLSKLRPCHTIRQASSRRPILNHTPDEVPHLFICGPSGKTVFVQHLIVSRAGQVVVLDPKWQRGKWGGAPPAHWGYAELAEALDAAARRCGALTERVNAQTAARMRAAEGGAGGLLAGLLLAYVSIAPAGLGLVGESLCLLLRGLLRLARAAGWALGVIWGCAWGEAVGPAAAALARLLLALALVVWLPLAAWDTYDRELRSWPCRAASAGAIIWANAEPSHDAEAIQVGPNAELRCFTRAVTSAGSTWRRVTVDGRAAWVQEWLVVER